MRSQCVASEKEYYAKLIDTSTHGVLKIRFFADFYLISINKSTKLLLLTTGTAGYSLGRGDLGRYSEVVQLSV